MPLGRIGTPTVGTWTEAISGTTTAVPYPSSVAAGACSVMIASQSSLGNTIFTVPAGWTQVFQGSVAANTILPCLFVAIKANAAGTEGGTSVTVTHTTGAVSSWQILSFPGVDTVTPQDVTASVDGDLAAALTTILPAVTIATPGTALVAAAAQNSTTTNATPPTAPAAFTETGDRVANTRAMEVSYLLGQPTGTTGAVTVNWSGSARSRGVLLALRPAQVPNRPRPTINRAAIVRASTY